MYETDDHDFYTIPEAARRLKVSEATIWRWIESKRLAAYRVGPRRIRIRKPDLESVVHPIGAKTEPEGSVAHEKQRQAIWDAYDPGRVRAALRKSAGALRGVHREAFLADLREGRGQGSSGRPT